MEINSETVTLTPDWSQAEALPLVFVNTFASMLGGPGGSAQVPDGILLHVGYTTPPLILGGPEEAGRAIEALNGKIPVTAVGRYLITRDRAEELIGILHTAMQQIDAATREAVNHG